MVRTIRYCASLEFLTFAGTFREIPRLELPAHADGDPRGQIMTDAIRIHLLTQDGNVESGSEDDDEMPALE